MLSICLVHSTKCLQEILLHKVSGLNAMNVDYPFTNVCYKDISKRIDVGDSFVPSAPNSEQNPNRNLHSTRPDDILWTLPRPTIPSNVPLACPNSTPFMPYNHT